MVDRMEHIPADSRDRDEEALVAGLLVGDTIYIKDFLRRAHPATYAMTARLSQDFDQRHDWCQDILLRVVKEMGTGRFVYGRPGCFWAWFKARANFLLINLYHQNKKHTERWTTGEVGESLAKMWPQAAGETPQKILESADARRVIEECLDELASEDQRRALSLVLFQDQTYQDVTELMGSSLNTVRSWIRRARIAMRQCVAGKYAYGEEE